MSEKQDAYQDRSDARDEDKARRDKLPTRLTLRMINGKMQQPPKKPPQPIKR